MKKYNSYMDRALQSSDPRYARILGKLGYERRDLRAVESVAAKPASIPQHDEITLLRAEYERVVGKRPYMGWDEAKLREKIAEAKAAS
ncbi:hypothetical protein [Shinella zoogloeoides]|uniref:hypothetical protein n=1 Tax=Shinella zoogloeoides TaxID=352475 RepID=UPI001F5989A1|nr:hypothetical protein [Shinella zoogloeoides]